ncbi:putative ABC transport system permease protein [Haloactinospora alba]|uniref:Putative ABC transport system permease protein n=1 Tax=Haloactinospora alba TaxID=405555 RepID=A0A543NJA3_9ACTN|nr:FtsX-like permease family protein [Haloactinospora alba]TQN31850.1 putative ABC transport system permease protein [Haloactinospora alba]
MLRTTLAGLRMHTGRLVATALAIVLGVMFVSGTLVFSDTLEEGVDSQVMGSASDFESIVTPEEGAGAPADAEPPLTPELLDRIEGLDEVASASGTIQGDTPVLDKDGRALGQTPTTGISVDGDTRHTAATGELPSADDEMALATTTAEQAGYEVGDEVTVLGGEDAKHTFTVTGLIDFGVESPFAFSGGAAFTPQTAEKLTGKEAFSEIDVRGAEGVPPAEVTDAVAEVSGSGAKAQTGTEMGEELAEQSGAQVQMLSIGLLLFALIAMFTAAIVIYNTFAVLIAQRQREMALLRCVGARRGQVFRGVLLEALIVGAVSSVIGVAAGIGLGTAGFALSKESLGAGGATTSLVVTPTAVGLGVLVGTVVTLLAALLPARKATKVSPLAALRTSAAAAGMEKGIGWLRTGAAVLLFAVSACMTVLGQNVGQEPGLFLTVGAAMLAFLGVVVVGPLIVRGIASAVRLPMRAFGVPGKLAADNSQRGSRRAATAMIALTIGATLITGYAVFSSSMQSTMEEELAEQFPADYVLNQQFGTEDFEQGGIPADVVDRLQDSEEIAGAYSQRSEPVSMAGEPATAFAYTGAELGTDLQGSVVAGELSEVGPGSVAVAENMAGDREVGDTVKIGPAPEAAPADEPDTSASEEEQRSYTIAAITPATGAMYGITMDPDDFSTAFPDSDTAQSVYVTAAEDAATADSREAVNDAIAEHPTIQVQSTTEMKEQFEQVLDIAFASIAAMLGLALVIAVFGVANTMALSVLERRRESAMLRALGLSGGQLRRMLSLEAVLLCLTGAGIGVVLGVTFGWAGGLVAFSDLVLTIPIAKIGLFLAAAVVAGLLAAALPAHRAARTSITGALASE